MRSLNDRVDATIDYTIGDAIIDQLATLITCPIKLEDTPMMIIFNDQCYDYLDFDRHQQNEYRISR